MKAELQRRVNAQLKRAPEAPEAGISAVAAKRAEAPRQTAV